MLQQSCMGPSCRGSSRRPGALQPPAAPHQRPTATISSPPASNPTSSRDGLHSRGGHAASQPQRTRLRAVAAPGRAAAPGHATAGAGHSALLHGLGDVGDVSPAHLPWLLRLAHIKGGAASGADSAADLAASARGLAAWRAALCRGLLADDAALETLVSEREHFAVGHDAASLAWPAEPLRAVLLRGLGRLGAARFAAKYPAVRDALLRSILESTVKWYKAVLGIAEEEEAEAVDQYGNKFKSVRQLLAEEAAKRAIRAGGGSTDAAAAAAEASTESKVSALDLMGLPADKKSAVEIVKELYMAWQAPISALSRAGRAFDGLEALLGGAGFELGGNIWKRAGWATLDEMRRKLEDIRELRDLVRSLGRGGGWGPLRRAPVQYLDMAGRPGLLRTVLEAQETRGLTRSDDISRLLPAEAATLARGRQVRQAKLLFYARLAEKGLQTYERDGWGEFPTQIIPERREVRPTADRGPILLCVDTSGSMRGAREAVAKALALECMRAAREQERNCYVFAFAGPQEVRELELNNDMASVLNLLDFLEKVFNGGSDFNEPLSRCLARLHSAKWANSDILLVSDGELRQPGPEIMRQLSGAKEKLGLRVHGLIVGSPEKKRADPAVLRSLCTNLLPRGKVEVLVSEFSSWASVQADASMQFDWDDAEGNARRRLAGLAHEKARQAESRRKRTEARQAERAVGGVGAVARQRSKKH